MGARAVFRDRAVALAPLCVALNLYAFRLADLQHVALQSAYGMAMYLVLAAVAAMGLRIIRRRGLHRQPIQFEIVAADRFEALNLSGSVN